MYSPNTRILIVDDFPSMRKITIQVLRELGFTDFIEAEDGNVAWNALLNIKPSIQLIICDWNMPNATGLDFLKKLRSYERYEKLPFILSTTKGDKESVLEAVASGANNFIVKPFTVDVFKQKLESVYQKLNPAKN